MKKKRSKVTVVDYGIGNLLSVIRGLEKCGTDVILTDSADLIANADRLILPGVGAFYNGMAALHERMLIEPISMISANWKSLSLISTVIELSISMISNVGCCSFLGSMKKDA